MRQHTVIAQRCIPFKTYHIAQTSNNKFEAAIANALNLL